MPRFENNRRSEIVKAIKLGTAQKGRNNKMCFPSHRKNIIVTIVMCIEQVVHHFKCVFGQ